MEGEFTELVVNEVQASKVEDLVYGEVGFEGKIVLLVNDEAKIPKWKI